MAPAIGLRREYLQWGNVFFECSQVLVLTLKEKWGCGALFSHIALAVLKYWQCKNIIIQDLHSCI